MACSSSSTTPLPLKCRGDCSTSPEMQKDVLNASPRPFDLINPNEHLDTVYGKTCIGGDSEKEHTFDSSACLNSDVQTTPKSSAKLMEEIATLEVEIMHLEKYLLSLYRSTFRRHLPMIQVKNVQEDATSHMASSGCSHLPMIQVKNVQEDATSYLASSGRPSPQSKVGTPRRDINSPHCQSSPTRGSAGPKDLVTVALPSSPSRKEKQKASHEHHSLAEHLGHSRIDNALVHPDKLSEDIMRSVSSIYCKLASPMHSNKGCSASSTSSFCSSSTFSPKNLSGHWSPQYSEEVTENCEFESLKLENGQSTTVVEVLKICLDDESYSYAATMLKKFRSLVKSLEIVNPMKMKREQKLAFWINIHNALLMHAYLAYGTQNYVKSNCMVKAAYNVGGHCINAYDIQSSILGIRSHYSATWLQTLVSPGKKFKTGNTKHPYAIDYPEPLVHFALCSGSYWDPTVRIYTAKTVFEDLEAARAEFIQSTVYFHKETKIYLPKILCFYAKDRSLSVSALLEVVSEYVSDGHRKAIKVCVKGGRPSKQVHWLDQTSFRYLIHKKIAQTL